MSPENVRRPVESLAARRALSAVSLAVGVVLAAGLHAGLSSPFKTTPSPVKPARVAIKARAAAPAPAAAAEAAPKEVLPLKTTTASAGKLTPKHVLTEQATPKAGAKQAAVSPPVEQPPVAEPPPVVTLPTQQLPTLSQPSFPENPKAVTEADLPLVGVPSTSAEAPPMPGARPAPPIFPLASVEKPGGPVLVLGLLVNDQGIVEETYVAVPSLNLLSDLTFALSYRGQKYEAIDPPMSQGERRWLELRIDYRELARRDLVLP